MENILRAATTYFILWFLFRLSGKRTLAQFTPFDAVLLLIISETCQSALVASDRSFTGAFVMILTLVGMDIAFSYVKHYSRFADRLMDGEPVVLLDTDGIKSQVMNKERVDVEDILASARRQFGIESLEEIRCAILEQNGEISIVPKSAAK